MSRPAARSNPASPGSPAPLSTGRAVTRPPAAALWLCLGLPRLPLEVRGGEDDAAPRVIVQRAGRVVQASLAAAESGVSPGLPLNAALALCPELAALARDEAAERAALERLAAWAGAFTPCVSLVPPAALLLEVRGSLRLFGGLSSLRQRLRAALALTGHAGRDAVAPTPLAALWLARAGDDEAVTELAALAGRVGRLRPAVTGWPQDTLAMLRSLGVESLADCLRLPRDGFARRVGRAALADLDRALGRRPDPRVPFQAPPSYRGAVELAAETTDTARLERAAGGLFAELEGFLRARQRAVNRLMVRLVHLRRPPTGVMLGLVAPGLEAAHFAALFAERLERLSLPAPVVGIELAAGPGEPLDPALAGLFGDEPGGLAGLRLVERLRARLGRESVHGLEVRDEHRPEQAWRVAEPGGEGYAAAPAVLPAALPEAGWQARQARPTWLLEAPRPLHSRDGRPWLDGALALERGPERLESGWWDGHGIARDYWVARTAAGARLWIYRELAASGQAGPAPRWFLHGVFG
jgi:protein ImuB